LLTASSTSLSTIAAIATSAASSSSNFAASAAATAVADAFPTLPVLVVGGMAIEGGDESRASIPWRRGGKEIETEGRREGGRKSWVSALPLGGEGEGG